jgi:hypothetical protein
VGELCRAQERIAWGCGVGAAADGGLT